MLNGYSSSLAAGKSHFRVILILTVVLGLVVMATAIRALMQPRKHSVFACYYLAGIHWNGRQGIYDKADMAGGVDVFRYHPIIAVMMVPWSYLPENIAGMVWRIFGGCCLGTVMVSALRAESSRLSAKLLAFAGIPWIVCSLTSLNNGQLNVELVASVAGATLLAMNRHSMVCGALLGLAVILKIYPVAYLGLFALTMPWRTTIVASVIIVALSLIPLATGSVSYALSEYKSWVSFLGVDDRSTYSLKDGYRDLWMLWRLSGIPTHRPTYIAMQILGGMALCLPVIWAHNKMTHQSVCRMTFGLATGWILLLGPSSESSTYMLIGPWLFWVISESCNCRRGIEDYCLYGSMACLVLSAAGGLFKGTGEWHAMGWHPGSAVFLVAWEIATFCRSTMTKVPEKGLSSGSQP